MIDDVVERLAENGDAELRHAGEVTLGEPTRLMDLREEDLLGRPFKNAPEFDPPLQTPQLDIRKPARETTLKVVEKSLGLKPRIEPEPFEKFSPNILERILPSPPSVRDSTLTGKQVGVAVLACRLLVDLGPISSISE